MYIFTEFRDAACVCLRYEETKNLANLSTDFAPDRQIRDVVEGRGGFVAFLSRGFPLSEGLLTGLHS